MQERATTGESKFPTKGNDEGIHLLEILVLLAKYKRLVVLMPFAVSVLAALLSLILPNIYTGTARILPPQQGGTSIAAILMGDTSSLNPSGAVGQALGLKNPADLYVGMLKSRTIADAIIQRFDLQKLYDKDTLVETRLELADASRIVAGREGIISIEVEDYDPKRAAALANAYVEELDQTTQRVTVTTAGRQRVFLEKQLRQAKDQLADAEVAMRATQEKTGLISVTEQGKAMIESVANLRALVAAKQVQLAAMRTGSTENNPDYVRVREELIGIRAELAKLEKSGATDAGNVIPSAGRIPEAGLEYIRKYRDVQYYQTLFELLAKQFEIAKSQEAADSGAIQILDRAVEPDKKTKPYRLLIVLAAGFGSLLFGIASAFVLEARQKVAADPVRSSLLEELRRHLGRFPYLRKP